MTVTIPDIRIRRVTKSRLAEVDFSNLPFGKIFSDHMLVADYQDGQWQDAQIVPFEPLRMSPASSVIHYGQSIFEGLKAYRNSQGEVTLFRADANFRRMNHSAHRMCMPEIPEELFMGGLLELLNQDRAWIPSSDGTSLYIRPVMFAADDYIGIRPSDSYKFIIFTSPVGRYYSEPVKVKVEQHYTRAAQGGTGLAKAAGNYAGSLYPARLAQQKGYHQLLWTDHKEHQYIEESGTMNVMFVINDVLITAPVGDTILDGITRDSVLTLAKDLGIRTEIRPIRVSELVDAIQNGTLTEAFGVGTAATISQIALINANGVDHILPAVETRRHSNQLLKALTDIRLGHAPDLHGWILRI